MMWWALGIWMVLAVIIPASIYLGNRRDSRLEKALKEQAKTIKIERL